MKEWTENATCGGVSYGIISSVEMLWKHKWNGKGEILKLKGETVMIWNDKLDFLKTIQSRGNS